MRPFQILILAGVLAATPLAMAQEGAPRAATAPAAGQVAKINITVGPDTTDPTGPLLPDGTVDYFQALNEKFGKGVTPENNALALLVQLMGTRRLSEDSERAQRIVTLLGVPGKVGERGIFVFWPGFKQGKVEETDADRAKFHAAGLTPWAPADAPELGRWLDANEEALHVAALAAERPRFWYPLVPGKKERTLLGNAWSLDVATIREIATALRVRAMERLKEGDSGGCWADLRTAHRLARLLLQNPELISELAALQMETQACAADWALLREGHLDARQLSEMLIEARRWVPFPSAEETARALTPYEFADAVQNLARQSNAAAKGNGEEFNKQLDAAGLPRQNWDRILRMGMKFYDDYLGPEQGLSKDQRAARAARVKAAFDEWNKSPEDSDTSPGGGDAKNWMRPRAGDSSNEYSDRLGKGLLRELVPSLGKANIQIDREMARPGVTQLVIALRLYKLDHGSYPDRLELLLPKYLSKLPPASPHYPVAFERKGEGYRLTAASTPLPGESPGQAADRKRGDIEVGMER